MVLAHYVALDRSAYVTNRASEAFAAVGVDVSTQVVTFEGDTTDAATLVASARRFVGGKRPKGVDVVLVHTSRNIMHNGVDVASGEADCNGGIRFAEKGFAWAEDSPSIDGWQTNGFRVQADHSAIVVAHEVGHALGAQHHHANCVEGASYDPQHVPRPCTVMDPTPLASLKFGRLEAAAMRSNIRDARS